MRSKLIVPAIILIVLALAGGGWDYFSQQSANEDGRFVLSGTIEVTETNLPTLYGGQVKAVYADEGDQIQNGQNLVNVWSTNTQASEMVRSPIDGVVLERLVEPDESVPAGSTVMVVAPLDELTLTVYVPENRYGQISLGGTYSVTVDSFPGETFSGRVSVISDKAEFTPRNVQTTDSRQTTVYAIKLDLEPTGGKLKPGMPADVHFITRQAP
jgi:multidrug efflux pump subunit AcrA (membrane-fusion protein)